MARRKKIFVSSFLGRRIFLALLGAGFLIIAAAALWTITLDIPDISLFESRKIEQSTKIYDRTGRVLLYDVHGDIQRTVIPLEEIPRHAKNATVAIEDSDFYNHNGISVEGIFRAIFTNITSGNISGQGGSTITQQLIKNSLLTSKKTITRKLKEIILALKLERVLAKEDILGLYLNEIPYGAQSYGIEAASQAYFGKSARDLSLAESAYLASLPKAPTYYSPYGLHQDDLKKRKNLVLARMNDLGFISKEETEEAMNEEVQFISKADESLKAPHFVMYVLDVLGKQYGEDVVETQGLRVTTSLDWELQQKAEDLTLRYVEEEKEKFNVSNAGMVALDPKTGHILVMVGSKDYFDIENDGNFNVTTALRQPGSSFKPIVYAKALQKGYTPKTVVFDLPTEFNSSCNPDVAGQNELTAENEQDNECYSPQNYDNIFRGPITLRDALAQSVNVASVKVLYLAGIGDSLSLARDLGIHTLADPARYGLTLVLGGGEVQLLELTAAYSVFANNGNKNMPTAILKIETNNGKILEEHKPAEEKVVDSEIASQINDILSDNAARSPAFGQQSFLYFPERQVAAKTGTTNDYRDAWVIGYTPNFALGVWFGNNDNTPMEKRVAGFIAAPLWNAFLQEVFKTLPVEKFSPPPPITATKQVLIGEWRGSRTYSVDSVSGKRATEYTPPELRKEKPITEVHSILYWVDKNDPGGPIPVRPEQDPQFNAWEYSVRKWAEAQRIQDQTINDIPKETDDVHLPEYQPRVSFYSPPRNIYPSSLLTFTLQIEKRFPISYIDIFIDNKFAGSVMPQSQEILYEIRKDITSLDISPGKKILHLTAYDEVGNKGALTSEITICGTDGC